MSEYLQFSAPGEGQKTCGHIDYKRMFGFPAAGFFRWRIDLTLAMSKKTNEGVMPVGLMDIVADLHLGGYDQNELLVARFAKRERRNEVVGSRQWGPTEDFSLEADIDGRCLAAIEDIRQGKDLQFQLKLSALAVVTESGPSFPTEANIRFQATQSDWLKVLEQMRYRRTMLLEIPVPVESKDPLLAEATKHLESAQKQFTQGLYRQSVSECRHVLECLKSAMSELGDDVPDEKRLSKEQRLARVNTALMKLTHLAHHTDSLSRQTEWRPSDARAILMMTGSLLQLASKDGE